MKLRILLPILALVALAAGVGIFCCLDSGTEGLAETSEWTSSGALASVEAAAAGKSPLQRIPRPTKGRTELGARPKPQLRIAAPAEGEDVEEEPDTRTPEEKKLADKIEKALDKEDFKLAIACAPEALVCANKEIRQSMVDTLGWFGSRALPELTPFLADADEEVREAAMMEWSMALSDVESDEERIKIAEMAMQALSDEDQLEEISNEYLGVDETLAVDSLLNVIEAGGTEAGVTKAKETYEFVTGDEFTNRADAERWVREQSEEADCGILPEGE